MARSKKTAQPIADFVLAQSVLDSNALGQSRSIASPVHAVEAEDRFVNPVASVMLVLRLAGSDLLILMAMVVAKMFMWTLRARARRLSSRPPAQS